MVIFKMVDVIGDGRPIQCPTLRGVRMNKAPCTKQGAICCLGCEYFIWNIQECRWGDWFKSTKKNLVIMPPHSPKLYLINKILFKSLPVDI